MKKSRFTEEQIVFALKQAELDTSVPDVCRRLGISDATFYAWRKKYGGISPSELKHMRQLNDWRDMLMNQQDLHALKNFDFLARSFARMDEWNICRIQENTG